MTKTAPIYESAPLTPRENDVLQAIRAGGGEPVRASAICLKVYGDPLDVCYAGSIRIAVKRLREKGYAIATIRGYGYRLITVPVCAGCGRPMEGMA